MGGVRTRALRLAMQKRLDNVNLRFSSSLATQGYQTILPSVQPSFPPGLYLPRRARSPLLAGSNQQPRYIPFETINGLYFISTRNDTGPAPPKTRANEVIIFSRKFGHCPLQTLWDTRKVVTGLESLADSHFPRNYISADVCVSANRQLLISLLLRLQFHLVRMKSGTWIPFVQLRLPLYLVTAIIHRSLVAILVMFVRMDMHHHLKFRRFRSAGMLILPVSGNYMVTLVSFAVITPLLMFHEEPTLSVYPRVFAPKLFVPPKVIRMVLPNV
jgi:hypothetical protein